MPTKKKQSFVASNKNCTTSFACNTSDFKPRFCEFNLGQRRASKVASIVIF